MPEATTAPITETPKPDAPIIDPQARTDAMASLKASRAKHGTEEPKQDTKPAPVRAEDGKFAAKADDAPAEATATPHPKVDPAKQDKYAKAVTALLKDGYWSQEEIDAMPPELVMSKAEKAEKRQSDVDREFQSGKNARAELETLKAKLAESEAAKANPQGTTAETGQTAKELASAVQTLSTKFKDALGDDLGLQGDFDALVQQIIAASKPDLSSVRAIEHQMNTMIDGQQRDTLSKTFTELKDDKDWAKVCTNASALVKSGIQPDRAQALKSAAAMEFGLAAAERATAKTKAVNEAKDNGQPYSGTQKSETSAAVKPENAAKTFLQNRRRELASESR